MRHQNCLFQLATRDLEEITRALTPDAASFRRRSIFITGGTGFFGKWLVGALVFANRELSLDSKITVLSRDPGAFLRRHPEVGEVAELRFVRGEVDTFEAEPGERPDLLIHAATDTLGVATPTQEEARTRAIVEGTRRLLALARLSGGRLLNVSSGGIYGTATAQPGGAREDDAETARPATPYGRAKRAAEILGEETTTACINARCFAFLGPHLPLDAHYAAGNFLRAAQRGLPITVRGDGTAVRSYLYPTDLVVWLLRMLLHGKAGRAYNVGSDEAITTGDLARRIAALTTPSPPVIIAGAAAPTPANIYLPDLTRTRLELGLRIAVDLDEAIRRTLDWLTTSHP